MSEKKSELRIQFKSTEGDAPGTFSGLLSPYGNVDGGNDIVHKGAFTKTIQSNGGKLKLLWQHDQTEPIGTIEMDDRPDGLYIKGSILLDPTLPTALKAHTAVKHLNVDGLSIGYQVVRKDVDEKTGVRNIREAKLFEGSIVTFPMNEDARIFAMKDMGDGTGDLQDQMDDRAAGCAGYVILSTLTCSLDNAWSNASYDFDGDLSEDLPSLISYAEDMFNQAKEAWLTAFAKWGNMNVQEDPETMKALTVKVNARIAELKAGKTKRVAGEDLPSSAFLIVGDANDTSTWKLPWKFSDEGKIKSHLRNALARIDQVQGVSAADLAAAKKKLASLAKDHGIDASKDAPVPEVKVGRKVSAETGEAMKTDHMQIKSAMDTLTGVGSALESLYNPDAVVSDDTSEDNKTAAPDSLHSVVESLKSIL